MSHEMLGWYLFSGACVLLLLGINIFLARISTKMDWYNKWRSEEKSAIQELQIRCQQLHPELGEITKQLSNP